MLSDSLSDPFGRLHDDVHSFIIQHLTAGEVLKLSEVSTQWNQNLQLMLERKVWLKVKLSDFDTALGKDEFVLLMAKSSRNYQSVRVTTTEDTQEESYSILRKIAPRIKNLEIKHQSKLEDGSEIKKFLKEAKRIQYLSMYYVPHPSVVNTVINTLPCLTKIVLIPTLRYDNIPDDIEEPLDLQANTKITNAIVYTTFKKDEFKKILLALPNLKVLRVDLLQYETMEFAALNLLKLEDLIFVAVERGCREKYELLKQSHPKSNQNIQLGLINIFSNLAPPGYRRYN